LVDSSYRVVSPLYLELRYSLFYTFCKRKKKQKMRSNTLATTKFLHLLIALLLGAMTSCNAGSKTNGILQAVEKTDTCRLDMSNSYEVFVPETRQTAPLALLVIVNAHGAGKFALNKFKSAAMKYPMVLVASNTVKNGFGEYDTALQMLIDDVRKKYPVGKTLFLTGFSGGARMTLGYALGHPVDGLILCGALAGREQIAALSCPVISISGTDDFNFPETAQYLFQDAETPANLKIELTRASHSWPDSLMMANAVGYLQLSASKDCTPSETILANYTRHQQARIDSLKKQGDLLRAALIARNMASVPSFDPNQAFASTYNSLKADNRYISMLSALGNCLDTEIAARQTYMNAFRSKELTWWNREINNVNQSIKTEQDTFKVDMYRRITGFWGISCYSLCKQAVSQQNAELLQKTLAIYETIEPDNADMFYFSAFRAYWKGDTKSTIEMLKKAQKAGFSDETRLKSDFPVTIWSGM